MAKTTETVERVHARCDDCNKVFSIPDPGRAYTCKACGGTVRAVGNDGGAPDPLQGTVTCPECHAINVHGAHFCAECKAPLGTPPLALKSAEVVNARREASNELRRAYRWIGWITWFYRLGAAGYGAVTVVAIAALASTEVPLEGGLLVVALSGLLTAAMFMGAIQILFRPFIWTVAIALLASAVAVAHSVGPNPLELAHVWNAAWALVFWAAVLPTLQFRRLIAAHTDLYITHHASLRTKRSLEGHSPKEQHERLVRAMRRAAARAWRTSALAAGAIGLVMVLSSYLVCARLRPQHLDAALAHLEAAWNGDGVAAVGELYLPEVRAQETKWLAGVIGEYGWGDELPRLQGGERRPGSEAVWVDYELDGIPLSTHWRLGDRVWTLLRIDLPIPPFEPAFERLLAAWDRSDARAIAALFGADHEERMLESLENSVELRNWHPFPEVLDTAVAERVEDGKTVATLSLEGGDVRTTWLFEGDGRWSLHKLELPYQRGVRRRR